MATSFTSKDPQLRGWVGPHAAHDMVQRAMQRYRERQKGSGSEATPAAASQTPVVTPQPTTQTPGPTSSQNPGQTSGSGGSENG